MQYSLTTYPSWSSLHLSSDHRQSSLLFSLRMKSGVPLLMSEWSHRNELAGPQIGQWDSLVTTPLSHCSNFHFTILSLPIRYQNEKWRSQASKCWFFPFIRIVYYGNIFLLLRFFPFFSSKLCEFFGNLQLFCSSNSELFNLINWSWHKVGNANLLLR